MKSNIINILVLNCGSSSLKYRLIQMPTEVELVSGEAQRVGIKSDTSSTIIHKIANKTVTYKRNLPSHEQALSEILEILDENKKTNRHIEYHLFAHRYVHPGNVFTKTTLIKKTDLNRLEKTLGLAPIHNPISYSLVKLCSLHYANIDQYLVFDTSFHKSIPPENRTYALPLKIKNKSNFSKLGFHGISHQYVMETACNFLKRDVKTQKIISCHLGSGGSSVCAIKNGKSINSSMGYTPLEGLIMNTRSGDIDLGFVFYYMFSNSISRTEMEKLLNNKSGILSIFKESSDLRDAIKKMAVNPNAIKAVEMYVRRIQKYIGYYLLLLKKTDIIIFTDTLGVEEPDIRSKICSKLKFWGISINEEENCSKKYLIREITAAQSQSRVLIIPTNEELLIAREAYKEYLHEYNR